MLPPRTFQCAIETSVREDWGRILSVLVKGVGDIQLAEDCLQDAIVQAMSDWAKTGLPQSTAGWLVTVARRRAIDRLRRDQNFATKQSELSYLMDLENQLDEDMDVEVIPDKRLEMMFTCCHPALAEKTRVALTLRTLGGLSTEEIAASFLDKPDAMAARLTRAKAKISGAGIPYRVPDVADLPERLGSVLTVVYLIFNKGVSRFDLSREAIRLGRILSGLLPSECEVSGLLALMLIHDARRGARVGPDGDFIPLEAQNRSRWNRAKIDEGVAILTRVLPKGRVGPYQLQAAINAVHGQAPTWDQTDWREIAALYEVLYRVQPTPVVRINQAVAISYTISVNQGLEMLEETRLETYQPYWAARADLQARSGRTSDARASYDRAMVLSDTDEERAFLASKRDQL